MKTRRHSKIIELINKFDIETQEELLERLKACGFNVTQATISRDVRELKLIKAAGKTTAGSRQVYAHISTQGDTKTFSDKLARVFKEGALTIDYAANIIVVKTIEGMAMAVAAGIDGMGFSEIIGCIAGDDTIMCVCRTEQDAVFVTKKMRDMM